jgi:hypothetical protein
VCENLFSGERQTLAKQICWEETTCIVCKSQSCKFLYIILDYFHWRCVIFYRSTIFSNKYACTFSDGYTVELRLKMQCCQ